MQGVTTTETSDAVTVDDVRIIVLFRDKQQTVVTHDIRSDLLTCFLLVRGKSVRSWCNGSSDQYYMVDPLSIFLVPASAPQLV